MDKMGTAFEKSRLSPREQHEETKRLTASNVSIRQALNC